MIGCWQTFKTKLLSLSQGLRWLSQHCWKCWKRNPGEESTEEVSQEFLKVIDIGRGQKVLDFGCGSGNYTIPSNRRVYG